MGFLQTNGFDITLPVLGTRLILEAEESVSKLICQLFYGRNGGRDDYRRGGSHSAPLSPAFIAPEAPSRRSRAGVGREDCRRSPLCRVIPMLSSDRILQAERGMEPIDDHL